jgi:hypothetical protein
MNLDFAPEDIAFREEVRAFIAENYPPELRGKQDEGEELSKADMLAWHKILAKQWGAPAGRRRRSISGPRSRPGPTPSPSCRSASPWSRR